MKHICALLGLACFSFASHITANKYRIPLLEAESPRVVVIAHAEDSSRYSIRDMLSRGCQLTGEAVSVSANIPMYTFGSLTAGLSVIGIRHLSAARRSRGLRAAALCSLIFLEGAVAAPLLLTALATYPVSITGQAVAEPFRAAGAALAEEDFSAQAKHRWTTQANWLEATLRWSLGRSPTEFCRSGDSELFESHPMPGGEYCRFHGSNAVGRYVSFRLRYADFPARLGLVLIPGLNAKLRALMATGEVDGMPSEAAEHWQAKALCSASHFIVVGGKEVHLKGAAYSSRCIFSSQVIDLCFSVEFHDMPDYDALRENLNHFANDFKILLA
jgi:hypothetical protein